MAMCEGAPVSDVRFPLKGRRVFVAGHRGMVGQALLRRLVDTDCELVTIDRDHLDLRRQSDTERWIADVKPDVIVLCAARVGGIEANARFSADFLYDNLAIEMNVVQAAHLADVPRVMMLGSSCMFPRLADQPMREDSILTGCLEPTNEGYATAKIAGMKLCQMYRRQHGRDYIVAIPTNLFGPGDNFDPAASHVVPALIRKAHEAKLHGRGMAIWGSGRPRREFLYVEDAADALVLLLGAYSDEEPINVGGGEDVSIAELATRVAEVVGARGAITFDTTKPDGMPRKALDATRLLGLGWRPRFGLSEGLSRTYEWFLTSDNIRLGSHAPA